MCEDPHWVRMQTKTFIRWCNIFLRERGLLLHDLEDLVDGILLINLLEIITSKAIPHNKKPKIRLQRYENLSRALTFLNEEGIRLVSIDASDIGKTKLTIGLLWTIILRYTVHKSPVGSEKLELLLWVQSKIPEYNITNFNSDWSSGKPITALFNALLPGQVNLPTDFTNDPIKDASLGISKAQKHMEIPVLIDPEDMVNYLDDLCCMTYIAFFRNYVGSTLWKKNQAEIWPLSHCTLQSRLCTTAIVEFVCCAQLPDNQDTQLPFELVQLIVKIIILLN